MGEKGLWWQHDAVQKLPPGYVILSDGGGKWDGLRPGWPIKWDEKHGVWMPPGFFPDPDDPDRLFNQFTGQNAVWDDKTGQYIDTQTAKPIPYEQ